MQSKNKESILEEIVSGNHTKVRIAVTDVDGILRGKVIHLDKFKEAINSEIGVCDVVFGWDANDKCYDNVQLTGWHTGYPDKKAVIDINTFRKIPWENSLPFFLADFNHDLEGSKVCPRSLLKKIKAQCTEAGHIAKFSQEFEFFNFQGTPSEIDASNYQKLNPITPGMFGYSILRPSQNSAYFNDLFDLLLKFDIPLEGMHTETGPGVYEATIIYDDVLNAADKAVLFKTAVKEIAYKHNIMASFMAKWSQSFPGCGGHLHQSLWDIDGKTNLFWDEKAKYSISNLMESYIAGQLYCLPEVLPMYAPNVNSYKRLTEGAWAPTTLTWGVDNRTTAVRAITKSAKGARIETRVPGSDTNAYLVMAAALASGLYGIKHNLRLETPPTIGNGYLDKSNGVLPGNLLEATLKMKGSKIANELFGEDFTDHFTNTRIWEWKEYMKSISDWELKRYFEII